ncbi:hypothetical protein DFH06DRAFT_1139453 [Mycena polygramma]|nr:hypothetical protein DFH06DRAFT_1139453 [Mycena polygramma]
MHPSLRLSNLDKLPISSRPTAVCAPDRSLDDINRFFRALRTRSTQNVHFLPAHYILLDPTRIPTIDQLDPCSMELKFTVYAASVSVRTLLGEIVPSEVGTDLWPRLWRWTQFLWTFHEFLDALMPLPSERHLCIRLITFTEHICTNSAAEALITSTPGFQALLVRAWAFVLECDDIGNAMKNVRQQDALYTAAGLLTRGTVILEDRIEGAGGSIVNLASLVYRHLDMVGTTADAPMPDNNLWLVPLVLDIVIFTDGIPDIDVDLETAEPSQIDSRATRPLCFALESPEFVATLTIIAEGILETPAAHPDEIARKCLRILAVLFNISLSQSTVRIAVRNGLVHAVLACAQHTGNGALQDTVRYFLAEVLQPAVVHHPILVDLITAHVPDLDEVEESEFSRPDVWEAWKRFVRLVDLRHEVLRTFEFPLP